MKIVWKSEVEKENTRKNTFVSILWAKNTHRPKKSTLFRLLGLDFLQRRKFTFQIFISRASTKNSFSRLRFAQWSLLWFIFSNIFCSSFSFVCVQVKHVKWEISCFCAERARQSRIATRCSSSSEDCRTRGPKNEYKLSYKHLLIS